MADIHFPALLNTPSSNLTGNTKYKTRNLVAQPSTPFSLSLSFFLNTGVFSTLTPLAARNPASNVKGAADICEKKTRELLSFAKG